MKSKNPKKQILNKILVILMLLIMILSTFSAVIISFATDGDSGENYGDEETVKPEDDLSDVAEAEYENVKATLEEVLRKLNTIEGATSDAYNEFKAKVEKSNTIDISDEKDLRFLSAYVNAGADCDEKIFNITKDIRLSSNVEWDPIGGTDCPFKGTLNGNGYTIYGMTINSQKNYVGLIGYLGVGGTAKNIIIDDANICLEPNIDGLINDLKLATRVDYGYIGAIAGYADGATIENCINESNITGGSYVGGIVGVAKSNEEHQMLIKDCFNNGIIRGYSVVGGIAGYLNGKEQTTTIRNDIWLSTKIERCVNKGNVYGIYIDIGGIVGLVYNYASVYNSLNKGNVSGTMTTREVYILGTNTTIKPQNIGGIAGTVGGEGKKDNDNINVETKIVYCINEEVAQISGYTDVGGIVGQLGSSAGGHSVAWYCIGYSNKINAAQNQNKGVIAGQVGAYEDYQGGRYYGCYYYGENENFNETNSYINKYGAIGNITGFPSKATDKKTGGANTAFRITKKDNKYLWQGNVYEEKTVGTTTDIVKKGSTAFYYSEGKWHYAKMNADNSVNSCQDGMSDVASGQLPNYTGTQGFAASSDKSQKQSYQPYFYNIVKIYKLNSDGKALIDNVLPSIKNVTIENNNGNSIATQNDKILIKVQFEENIHKERNDLALKFKIGNTELNANPVGIDKDTIIFSYTVTGNYEGEIDTRSIKLTGTLEDIFENPYTSNSSSQVDSRLITNHISLVVKSGRQGTKTVVKQNRDSSKNTWAVTYELTGGKFVGNEIYLAKNDELKVEATIDHKLTNEVTTQENPILHITTSEDNVLSAQSITEDANKNTIITYRGKISKDGEIKKIYLSTVNDVTLSKTSGTTNYTVKLNQSNTGTNVGGIIIDNTPPDLEDVKISNQQYYAKGDKITVAVTFTEGLDEQNIPKLKVKFNDIDGKNNSGIEKSLKSENDKTVVTYDYTVEDGDNGILSISFEGVINDIAGNTKDLSTTNWQIDGDSQYADTALPTVAITAKKVGETSNISNSITNATNLIYTFTWSEEVVGFTADDITVNNGTKGTLSTATKNPDGTYSYTMEITPNVENGNEGNLQVIVEQNACQDLVWQNNVRTESVIRIDKKAPMLVSLESYGNSIIDSELDAVKQYYKAGDKVTIIATFSESIASLEENMTGLPKLTLTFSESGNAKGEVSGGIEGNKIQYIYTIQDGDEGNLSVKGFSGKVSDSAGNETQVTKRILDGDTVIANTSAPELMDISVVAPEFKYNELLKHDGETKRYGVGETIDFCISFDKEVYELSDGKIKDINKYSRPHLNIKIGTAVREAEFKYSSEGILYYSYTIVDGDNGDLSILSLQGTVWDEAGNKLELGDEIELPETVMYETQELEENVIEKITVDTTKPTFTITTSGINYDDNKNAITGTGYNYRKGGVIEIIVRTNEYVYDADLNNFTKDTMNFITLKFGETSAKGTITYEEVRYSDNKTEFKYKYTITDGDNGTLQISIDENKISDIALNKNIKKTENLNVVADTINPTYKDNNGDIVYDTDKKQYVITFNEELYSLDENNNRISATAPKLKFEHDETEISGTVRANVITYNSTSKINGKEYLSGNSKLCDKAGNLYSYFDYVAPVLKEIKVISPETGIYNAGTKITINAIFSEKIKGTVPTLMIQFGDGASRTISVGEIEENIIKYEYTIQNEDNGELNITDYNGNSLTDLSNNPWTKPEILPTLSGNEITADTIAPTVIITSDVERTNRNTVTYTFTWSEQVKEFTKDSIELTNGLKGEFKQAENSQGKVYTLTVDKQAEGTQIIRILPNTCKDIAGNSNNTKVVYDQVFIDCTKPIIRAKVNGGTYAVDTESNKSTLKETIVVNEELSEFKYIWSTSATMPTTGLRTVENIQVNSDINLSQEISLGENQNNAEYYLYIKVTDLAGNVLEARTNKFMVKKSVITLTANKTDVTNEDVEVTIGYDGALTENKKAGISGKTQSADSNKVIVSENGIVYAEASDKAGNKVYNTLEISNIDKTVPEATITYRTNDDHTVTAIISFNEQDVTVTNNSGKTEYKFTESGEFTFEFKDKAGNKGTALAKVESIDKKAPVIIFKYTLTTTTVGNSIGATIITDEESKISYSWDNKNWTESKEYITNINAVKSPTKEGTYTLYAKATDKSGNTSDVEKLEFTVVKSIENSDISQIVFEGLYTTKVNGLHYVKVSSDMTSESVKTKMNNTALNGATPEFANLTKENKLKTGSEIKLNGETKYIVIVNGDVNCDGKIDFLGDIITANNYRIGIETLNTMQKLAADIDNDGKVEFITDILAMNNYRIGVTKSL